MNRRTLLAIFMIVLLTASAVVGTTALADDTEYIGISYYNEDGYIVNATIPAEDLDYYRQNYRLANETDVIVVENDPSLPVVNETTPADPVVNETTPINVPSTQHDAPSGGDVKPGTDETVSPLEYSFLAGENGVWAGENAGLSFRVDSPFEHLTDVQVDGASVAEKDRDAYSGSTFVVLKADYLKTLSEGEHTLTVVFDDGAAKTHFTIRPAQAAQNVAKNAPQQAGKPAPKGSPKTGDPAPVALLAALTVLFAASLALVLLRRKELFRR